MTAETNPRPVPGPTPAPHTEAQPGAVVLEARALRKTYGRVEALRDLNLRVQARQIYGFLGPNGAGKTTAIRILLGLTPASGGEAQLFGQPASPAARARVGALVETPTAYAHLSGTDNLRVMARLRGSSETEIPDLLARVGLRDAAHRAVRGYSLGMRGRLAVASALLGNPELLLLDEPTNGLDPSGIREVRDLIRALPADGHTVVLSSHLLAEIEQVATHVGIVAAGVTRFEGSLGELQGRSSGHLRVTVEHPAEALVTLRRLPVFAGAHVDGAELVFAGPQAQHPDFAADLNHALVTGGHRVFRLTHERLTLEDLFLQLVGSPPPASATPVEVTA